MERKQQEGSFWKGLLGQSERTTAASSKREKVSILDKVNAGNGKELRVVLAKGGDPNERYSNGVPALALAAMKGDHASAQALVEFGADVDVTDSNGWTPLMHAVMQGKNLACVEVLLQAGAEIGTRLKSGIGLDTLANNSTPEIRNAIERAFGERTAAMLDRTLHLSGKIATWVKFGLTSLSIDITENGSSRTSFGIPGTRINALIDKTIGIEYSDAEATITKDVIEIIAGCWVNIEKQFEQLVHARTWDPGNETFRLTTLVPIVVNSLEPWTETHLKYSEMTIRWALA